MKFRVFLYIFLFSVAQSFSHEVAFSFEKAADDHSKAWGLMGRINLPDNHGMLFENPKLLWMFNMQFDLSVAFINKEGVILSIVDLLAYPDMMDPNRKISSVKDFDKYSYFDKSYQFFLQKAVKAPQNTQYALEMKKGWFDDNHVKVGDVVFFRQFDGWIKI